MLTLKKSNKTVNIIIEDYVIRFVETHGNDLSSIRSFTERPLPKGLIENGRIHDEIGFYEFMKGIVKELRIKNRQVRFNVPHAMVIMRQVEVPATLESKKDIIQYLEIEVGQSIHLPFQDPIIDLPDVEGELPEIETDTRKVTFFAAPEEEVRKYTEVFIDVNLKPISVDVGILSSFRYFHQTQSFYEDRVYLIIEFNLNSVYLGIFQDKRIEFIRYQELDLNVKNVERDEETNKLNWKYEEDESMIEGLLQDQVNEFERIMNFYRYSLHKGEDRVTDIVLLGESPYLDYMAQLMDNRYDGVSFKYLKEHELKKTGEHVEQAFLPALGLALRGGK